MNKIQRFLRHSGFHVLLIHLSVLVVSWPFLSSPDLQQPAQLFVYLFVPWAIIIVLLALMSHSYITTAQVQEEQDPDD